MPRVYAYLLFNEQFDPAGAATLVGPTIIGLLVIIRFRPAANRVYPSLR